MLNIALNASYKFRQRVAVFSLEMSGEQVVERLVAQAAGIDGRRLQAQHGLDMVVLDYLQLMTANGRHENRVAQYSRDDRPGTGLCYGGQGAIW